MIMELEQGHGGEVGALPLENFWRSENLDNLDNLLL